MFTYKIIAN